MKPLLTTDVLPIDQLAAAGAAVQRAFPRHGLGIPVQVRQHVALHDRETGYVAVVPLLEEHPALAVARAVRSRGR